MKKACAALIVLALTALSAVASADVKVYSQAKLQVTTPEGWKLKEANGVTLVGGPTDEVGQIIWEVLSPTPETLKKDMDKLTGAMGVKDMKWADKPMTNKVNGLDAILIVGSGTQQGKPHDFAMLVVGNGKNGLAVMTILRQDQRAKYDKILAAEVNSIALVK